MLLIIGSIGLTFAALLATLFFALTFSDVSASMKNDSLIFLPIILFVCTLFFAGLFIYGVLVTGRLYQAL